MDNQDHPNQKHRPVTDADRARLGVHEPLPPDTSLEQLELALTWRALQRRQGQPGRSLAEILTGRRTVAVAKPARSPRAAERRRRAAWLARALPAEIATDGRLTNAELAVLGMLYRLAREVGDTAVEPSIPELAQRTALTDRRVQQACRALQERGWVAVTARPIRPGHNDTNRYELLHPGLRRRLGGAERLARAPLGRPPVSVRPRSQPSLAGTSSGLRPRSPAAFAIPGRDSGQGGETHFALNPSERESPPSHRVTSPLSQSCEPAIPHDPANPNMTAYQDGGSVLSAAPPARAPGLPRRTAPQERRDLALEALRRLAPPMHRKAAESADPDMPWRMLDRLRETQLGGFNSELWALAVRRHGPLAYLAVAETLLKERAGQLRSPQGYLWGILRRGIARGTRAEDCTPEESVAAILEGRRGATLLRGHA